MSESDGGAGQREVAYRVFAAEYDDADLDYSEGEDERSPNYVVTPTGARVNRLFVVGVLTEVEEVSEDVLRARVVDPTGAFVLYAGQYQPDEQAFLERAEPPMFVAVTGKARTFSPEDTDQVYTSVRPESINEVDAETRDRWTVQAAEETLYRVQHAASALSMNQTGDALATALDEHGVEEGLAAGVPLAFDHYETTPTYLDAVRELALDAARVVAGERDAVGDLAVSPDETGAVTVKDLVEQFDDVTTVHATVADETDPATTGSADAASADETATGGTAAETDRSDTASGESDHSTAGSSESAAAGVETATADTATEGTTTETTAETVSETATETTTETVGEPSGETTTETATETTAETEEPGGRAGDVSAGTAADEEETGGVATDDVADPGDFDPDEFELEDETREQIEEEYGTEFQAGTEVDDPGEAGIETPDPEEETTTDQVEADQTHTEQSTEESESADSVESTDAGAAEATDSAGADTAEPVSDEPDATDAPEPTEQESAGADAEPPAATDTAEPAEEEPDDMIGAVVDIMDELDDGDGANRETVVDTVTERYGTPADEVEDAIQEALMDGKCYEPDDTSVKPI